MKPQHTLLFSLSFLFILCACSSPQELVDYGNYDEAIALSVRKLPRKKKKRDAYIYALETAFMRANERDLAEVRRLKEEGRSENWEEIYRIYQRIEKRQDKVKPLLPLIETYGVTLTAELFDVDAFILEARQKSADFLYAKAQVRLEEAGQFEDRNAAREAYDLLRRTEKYYSGAFRNRRQLLQEAQQLGTTHIAVNFYNRTPSFLPPGFEREILGFNSGNLDSRWKKFHFISGPATGTDQLFDYDYRLEVNLEQVEIGPELLREREYELNRQIDDGFDYVLDRRGNVVKDSLGNDIRVPRRINVRAWVLESYQEKGAFIRARLDVFDLRYNRLVDSRSINAEALFEHRAGVWRGDERALNNEARRLVRRRPLPFPSGNDLLFDAADRLRPELRRTINRVDVI